MTKNLYEGKIYNEKTLLRNIVAIECHMRHTTTHNLFRLMGYSNTASGAMLLRPSKTFLSRLASVLNVDPEILFNAPTKKE